ncbi:MAG: FHA domain-containing protein [Pseudanabaenaceae cyanobacterium bins.68]|nr:FHA domain-containing protein [Pseudanabaenaceae cyanobacterium bins.68]
MNETVISHTLLITDAKGSRTFVLSGLKYTIGRDESNDIQLHSRFVSRQHAVMLRVPAPEPGKYSFRIIDGDVSGKPSVNGVLLNHQQKISSHVLCHGDIITLAPNVQLIYMTESVVTTR